MKEILYFYLPSCPFCRQADKILKELMEENPEYAQLKIKQIDESRQKELADSYDYYFVPCFYVDGVKQHEGVCTKNKVKAVLDKAL